MSASADAARQAANQTRQAARKALIELGSKTRLRRARLARPRQELQSLQFEEGEPVLVRRSGRRGTTAKVGPCWVILQRGHTVWISRRGEIWKCNVGQVFKMSDAGRAGLESIPTELLKAKTRLKYDTEKLQNRTWTLPPGGRDRGAGDASEQRPEPTEIPVPDPPGGDDEDLYSPDLTDASEQHPEPTEIPVPDPVVHNIDVSSHSGGSSGDVDVSRHSGGVPASTAGDSTSRSNSSSKTTGSTSSSSSLSSSSSPSPPKPAEWPPAGDGTQLRITRVFIGACRSYGRVGRWSMSRTFHLPGPAGEAITRTPKGLAQRKVVLTPQIPAFPGIGRQIQTPLLTHVAWLHQRRRRHLPSAHLSLDAIHLHPSEIPFHLIPFGEVLGAHLLV